MLIRSDGRKSEWMDPSEHQEKLLLVTWFDPRILQGFRAYHVRIRFNQGWVNSFLKDELCNSLPLLDEVILISMIVKRYKDPVSVIPINYSGCKNSIFLAS